MSQLVDPFIPRRPKHPKAQTPHTPPAPAQTSKPHAPLKRPVKTIDGFIRPREIAPPHAQQPQSPPEPPKPTTPIPPAETSTTRPAATPSHTTVAKPKAQKTLKHRTRIIAIVVGVIIIGVAMLSLPLGEVLIGIYTVYALWKRIPSRITFLLALIMFGGIVLTTVLGGNSSLATALTDLLAVYAFLLLCVGTLAIIIETRQET